ncbi:MAG: hypothetical protein ACR2O8_06615 [Rhizobiaceae bacterium]
MTKLFYRFICVAAVFTAANSIAAQETFPTARDHAELQKLLKWHIWYGKPVTRGVRAAAGDPDMPVFDNRRTRNLTHICSYIIYRGKRAIRCE